MVQTTENNLRLALPILGGDDNQWGAILNTAISEFELAVTGKLDVSALSSTDRTLGTGGAPNEEARKLILNCTGILSANIDIIAPLEPKTYIVKNGTTGAFTLGIRTPTGTLPLDIPQGETLLVWCDPAADAGKGQFFSINAPVSGTVALATNSLQLGGIVAASYAQKAVKNTWTNPQIVQANQRTLTSNAYTPDVDTDSTIIIAQAQIGGASVTINNPTNTPIDGQILVVIIEQHATTPQSVVWGSEFIFPDDSNIDLTQTANKVDAFSFVYSLNLDRWLNFGSAQNLPRS